MFTADQFVYRTSSYSGAGANCVEVAVTPHLVGVRDSKDRDGGTLAFTSRAWATFTAELRRDASE